MLFHQQVDGNQTLDSPPITDDIKKTRQTYLFCHQHHRVKP